MFTSTKLVVSVILLGAVFESAAFADEPEYVPTLPPDGYSYARRTYIQQMSASNMVRDDENSPWMYVATDADVHALNITDPNGQFDYYLEKWDDNQTIFDAIVPQGQFSGILGGWQYLDPDTGITYYTISQEINGVFHGVSFQKDSSGNFSQTVETKYKPSTDPCKIIADWGATMCPSHFGGIKEISTDVSSRIKTLQAHWYNTVVNDVVSGVEKGARTVAKALKNPKVLAYTLGAIAVVAIVGCCVESALTACVFCGSGILAGLGVAEAGVINANTPDVERKSDQLLAQGLIRCTDQRYCYDSRDGV